MSDCVDASYELRKGLGKKWLVKNGEKMNLTLKILNLNCLWGPTKIFPEAMCEAFKLIE